MSIKVLIIDDDVVLGNTLETVFQAEQFEVMWVDHGEAGIEAARTFAPDVILLDLVMPGIDGWQVCRTIRTFSQAPILIMSAVVNPDMVTKILDAGADDYIIKPTPASVLVSRLKRLARVARITGKEDKSQNN